MRLKAKNFWYETLPSAKDKKKIMAEAGMMMDPGPGFNPLANLPNDYFNQFYPQPSLPSRIPSNYSGPNTGNIPLPQQGSVTQLSPAQGARVDSPTGGGGGGKPQQPTQKGLNAGNYINMGLGLFDAALGPEKHKKQYVVQPEDHPVYNPYAYGTGSQAFYTGGQIMSTERTNPVVIPEGMEDNMPSAKKGGWIQKATASIKRRGTKGVCTGSNFGGPSCRPGTRRYALAKTFKKMAKRRKKGEDGLYIPLDMGEEQTGTYKGVDGKFVNDAEYMAYGGIIPDNMSVFYPPTYADGGQASPFVHTLFNTIDQHFGNIKDAQGKLMNVATGGLTGAAGGAGGGGMMSMLPMKYDGGTVDMLEHIVHHPNEMDMRPTKKKKNGGSLTPPWLENAMEIKRNTTKAKKGAQMTNFLEKIMWHPNQMDMAYDGQNVPNLLEKLVWHPNQSDLAGYDEGGSIARDALKEAIDIHHGHLNGTIPTSNKSQRKMMDLMEKAYKDIHSEKGEEYEARAGKQLTSAKAREILRDGTAQGHKLTAKQKRYFGWIAGGGKAAAGDTVPGGPGDGDSTMQTLAKNKARVAVQPKSDKAIIGYDIFNNSIATGSVDPNLYSKLSGYVTPEEAKQLVTAAHVFSQDPTINTMSGRQRLDKFYGSGAATPELQALKDRIRNFFGTGNISTELMTTPNNQLLGNAGIINKRVLEANPFASTYEQGGSIGNYMMFDDGGQVQTMWGGAMSKVSDNPHDGGTIQFNGPSHDNGGIGMHYNGNPVEVEGGETAAKDSQGNLNIFGNMYLPGTRTKFKAVSKEIADKERSYDRIKTKGASLVNSSNPANKYEQLTFNAGRVMMEGGDLGHQDLAMKKEKLSSLQKAMLDTADEFGIDAHHMSQGRVKKAKYGASVKKKVAAEGDVVAPDQQDPNDPKRADRNKNPGNIKYGKWAKEHGATGQDKDGFAIFPDVNTGLSAMKGLLKSPEYRNLNVRDAIDKWTGRAPYRHDLGDIEKKAVKDLTPEEFEKTITTMRTGEGTRYGLVPAKVTPPAPPQVKPPDFNPYGLPPVQPFTPEKVPTPVGATPPEDNLQYVPDREPLPTNAESLHMNEVLGEIYAAATNRQVPVVAQKYVPEQFVPYQMSFQDRLNLNQNSFAAAARQVTNNPTALATLAAQKYAADSAVKADEFRTNQAISQDVTNKNIALENDAQLKNLGIVDQQYVRQSTAASKTREMNQMILNSLSSKFAQNEYENKRLKAYENLYDYRFVPNKQGGETATYFGPNAMFNFNPAQAAQRQASDPRVVKSYDQYGNLKGYREEDDSSINERYKAIRMEMERRKLPLMDVPPLN